MSDAANLEVPEVVVEDESYSVEIVDETQEVDKTAALEAEIAELKAAQAVAPAPAAPQTDEGFAALAQEIRKLQPAPVQATPEPGVDYNSVVAGVRKDFYGDPTDSVLTLLNPIATGLKEEQDSKFAKQAVQISKLTVLATDEDKGLYVKYKDDVEAIAATLPPSENTYQEALQHIRLKYAKDLVQEQVDAALAQAISAAEANVTPGVTAQRQAPVTLATTPAKPTPTQNRSLNAAQWQDLQQQALIKGFDLGNANSLTADGVWAIERYKQNGGRL